MRTILKRVIIQKTELVFYRAIVVYPLCDLPSFSAVVISIILIIIIGNLLTLFNGTPFAFQISTLIMNNINRLAMHELFTNKPDQRRAKQDPIPKNLDQILNNNQKTTINDLESFGWRLWFVRRPLFQPVVPVLVNAANDLIAVIGENGAVDSSPNTTTKLSMRKRFIRDKTEMPDSDLFYFDTQQEMEFWM